MHKERLEQTQQLRLQQRISPQQVALGRVLEMSAPEFEEEVRRELNDNPALEEVRHDSAEPDGSFSESAEDLQRADYADDDDVPFYSLNARNRSADDPHFDFAALAADDSEDMMDMLMTRLKTEHELSPEQLLMAEYIIGNIDSNGYLTRPLASIAADMAMAEDREPSLPQLRTIFETVRSLDPPGIGAVDLRDCLLLQLQRRTPDATVLTAQEIICHHFDIFSKRHFERLQAELGISRENLADALRLILTLNPRPGAALGGGVSADRTGHITPDFLLDYDEETGRFTLSLGGRIPELAIEESFRTDIPDTKNSGEQRRADAEYIRRRRDAATAFISIANMRAASLTAIAKAITSIQRTFFVSGDQADLKPMILKDVAEITGLDISAVSRAVSGKYIQTPHGIYALKSLFNERPSADSDASTPEILKNLGELIDSEDKRNPLSDRELTSALAKRGYDIARRTVAKYRERLGHPPARLRKQL